MKIYFAHPVTDYGTERQAKAIAALERHWRENRRQPIEIENPDREHHQEGYAKRGMDYFKEVVESCWSLAFMRFPNGAIGAGVGREIEWALNRSGHVYEVFDGGIYLARDMPTPVLSVEDTRALLRELRADRNGLPEAA